MPAVKLWLCALWLASFALCARAEDTVILFERPPLRPGLCAALRIQLTGLAEVQCEPAPELSSLEGRIARAAQSVASSHARLSVLLEPDADGHARMLIVAASSDRALLAVEPVEARPEPDVDRALALKVRETFALARVVPTALLVPAPENRRLTGLLELGAAYSHGAEARAGALLALGVRRVHDRRYMELAAMGKLGTRTHARVEHGVVHEREWTLGGSARAGVLLGRFSLGPALDVGVARASASGTTDDGRHGQTSVALLRLDLGVDLRCTLWRELALRFAPALELDPVARRFALDGQALALGHVRAWLPLSLVLGL
jgi:hypothetical protein